MEKIYIVGTSGFAREVADIADALGYSCAFIAANAIEANLAQSLGEVLTEDEASKLRGCAFAFGIGENKVRRALSVRYHDRGKFPNLLHPSASFGRYQKAAVESGRGNIVCAGARLTNSIRFGDFCIINLNATIGHDCIIEDYVNASPGANISGNVHVKTGAWIGTGSAINQGSADRKLVVGENTMIGSGAVVIKDCDADAVYVGAPARRIK